MNNAQVATLQATDAPREVQVAKNERLSAAARSIRSHPDYQTIVDLHLLPELEKVRSQLELSPVSAHDLKTHLQGVIQGMRDTMNLDRLIDLTTKPPN